MPLPLLLSVLRKTGAYNFARYKAILPKRGNMQNIRLSLTKYMLPHLTQNFNSDPFTFAQFQKLTDRNIAEIDKVLAETKKTMGAR
jgi:hypothetical protein